MNKADLLRQLMAMLEHDHLLLLEVAASSQTAATHEYEFPNVC